MLESIHNFIRHSTLDSKENLAWLQGIIHYTPILNPNPNPLQKEEEKKNQSEDKQKTKKFQTS